MLTGLTGINVRAAGLDVSPVGDVDLVHLGKVVHAGEEDVDLDDLFDCGAGGLDCDLLGVLALDSASAILSTMQWQEYQDVTFGRCLQT